MMRNENGPLFVNSSRAKLLHKSPEGGTDTFGFGHKLTPEEQRTQTINGVPINQLTRDDAVKIFEQDLEKKVQSAKAKLAAGSIKSGKYGVVQADWDKLNDKQKQMLLDYEYNVKGGLNKFPSFVFGVINNDQNIMEQEYERSFTDASGKRQRLARNNDFYDLFFRDRFAEEQQNTEIMTGLGGFDSAMDFESPYDSQFNDPFQPAFELPSAPQQPAAPQYATMEDLLVDKNLMNPFDRYSGVV